MDWSVSRSRWRKRSQRGNPLFLASATVLLLLSIVILLSYSEILRSLLPPAASPAAAGDLQNLPSPCRPGGSGGALAGERFVWYAPHSGFSNQLSELKNALLFAAILNRTLIVPPVLDHHAVALGSCPKFRVSEPSELRAAVWDHIMDLIQSRRYVSMADIVDLSSLLDSRVKMIDFRVFASMWCGVNMGKTCFGSLCCALSSVTHSSSDSNECRSLLSGLQGNVDLCMHAVQEDCRTTVWMYQLDRDGMLDGFQPNKELQKKRKTSYIRKRRDVYKAFGPGSLAETVSVLSFGSLFSSPYRGSELYIDIRESPGDSHIQSLLQKIEFLSFVPEILGAGKEFSVNRIKEPFLCAQLRLLDGQFKNKWMATFSALEEKVKYLQLEFKRNKANGPIHIFIMTDLPTANWTGTYLSELAKDTNSFRLYTLQESDEIIAQTARRLMEAEHGLKSGFFPGNLGGIKEKSACESVLLPDILLYIEKTVCSCAALGFVGTAGSTIAQSIKLMVKNKVCKL